jgi:hypothetical protein
MPWVAGMFSVTNADIWNLIISISVFGLLIFQSYRKPTDKSQEDTKLQQAPQPLKSRGQIHHRLWMAIKWIVGTGVAVLAFLAAIDQFWGRPWPTDPEVHPLPFVSGTPLSHLFLVKNRSAFDMDNIVFTCGVDLMAAKDADGKVVGGADFAFVTGVFSIPRGNWINYACDASSFMTANPDGSLSIRKEMQTRPGNFRAPLTIIKMCLWIKGTYHLMWRDWAFQTIIYKWPASQNDTSWVEGPIAQEQTDLRNKGIDALECSPSVRFPYALFIPKSSRGPWLIFK